MPITQGETTVSRSEHEGESESESEGEGENEGEGEGVPTYTQATVMQELQDLKELRQKETAHNVRLKSLLEREMVRLVGKLADRRAR